MTRRHSLTQRGRSNFKRLYPKAAAAMGGSCVTPALQQQLTDLGTAHVGYSAMQLPQHSLSIVGARPFSKVHSNDARPMAFLAVICAHLWPQGTRTARVDGWSCLVRVATLGKTLHPSTGNCTVSGLPRRQGKRWQKRLQHSRRTMLWSSWRTMAAASWEGRGLTSAAWIGRSLQVCLQTVSRFKSSIAATGLCGVCSITWSTDGLSHMDMQATMAIQTSAWRCMQRQSRAAPWPSACLGTCTTGARATVRCAGA
jgi:hypothetical protein